MIRHNEAEEIIKLINNGFDIELLALELDVPIEQIEKYKEQLELRKFAKDSIKNGNIEMAIAKLNYFIENTDCSIIEKVMVLKLRAYLDKTNINDDELEIIEKERRNINFTKDIEEILNELQLQIPKRKTSNIKKKENQDKKEEKKLRIAEIDYEVDEEKEKLGYEEIIKNYQEKIANNSGGIINNRNLLAFAYFKAGKIEEAKDELFSLIESTSNYTAYRQLIYIEKSLGNLEDAKLWGEASLEIFPNSIDIREQLVSIAQIENNTKEVIKLLKEIISLDSNNKKSQELLEKVIKNRER